MAYTFYKALGLNVGTSKCEDDYVEFAKGLLEKAEGKIILPVDTVVAKEFAEDAEHRVVKREEFQDDDMGLDVGPETIEVFAKELEGAKTVVWNGPMGVFEFAPFAKGTLAVCEMLSNLDAITIIGGGDSAAAAISLGYEEKFSHISTGGGASLEYLEGKDLPGVSCLSDVVEEEKAEKSQEELLAAIQQATEALQEATEALQEAKEAVEEKAE